MELTFFIAAHTVQFGFVAKRLLTTHRCSGCGWTALAQYQHFICFPYSVPPVSVLGVGEKLGGTWLGQLTQTHQRDILWHITSCWATETEVEEEIFWWFWFFGGNFFLAPKTVVIWGKAGHQSACGRWWVISFVLCFSFHWWESVLTHNCLDFVLSHPADGDKEWTVGYVSAWLLVGVNSPQEWTDDL